MPQVSSLARTAVGVAARALDLVARPPRGIVVLAYHQVGAPVPGSVNLPVSLFRQQVERLAASGRVVTLDAAVERLASPYPPPVDPIVVTFDDGTADVVDHAVPILEHYGVPATLYLETDHVETGRSFWDDGTTVSWPALADAVSTGVLQIGSHTHTHLLCDRSPAEVVAADLDRSVELIGERLGVQARHFAYPKALPAPPGSPAAAAVRERFASAAVAGGRVNRHGRTDLWRLARTPITVADGLQGWQRKVDGGLRLEGWARERLDKRRYAGATR